MNQESFKMYHFNIIPWFFFPYPANENDCRVDKRVATCVGTVTLSGDCYYQYQLQGACSFTAVSVTRQRFEIYFPRRTKELYFEGAGGSKRYANVWSLRICKKQYVKEIKVKKPYTKTNLIALITFWSSVFHRWISRYFPRGIVFPSMYLIILTQIFCPTSQIKTNAKGKTT